MTNTNPDITPAPDQSAVQAAAEEIGRGIANRYMANPDAPEFGPNWPSAGMNQRHRESLATDATQTTEPVVIGSRAKTGRKLGDIVSAATVATQPRVNPEGRSPAALARQHELIAIDARASVARGR